MRLVHAAARLRDALDGLEFAPKAPYVYHPLRYAWEPHEQYLRRYGEPGGSPAPRRRAVFVGMNPGYWGMCQTGVPFGDAPTVRGWMGIEGRVDAPAKMHPARPVLGFAMPRRDASGQRFYAWAQARYGTAERFFRECFVLNYCPLVFFDAEGANVTPPRLPKAQRESFLPACDAHLGSVLDGLSPDWVFALGAWAGAQARRVMDARGLDARVETLLHPSPANPANNHGWAGAPDRFLDVPG